MGILPQVILPYSITWFFVVLSLNFDTKEINSTLMWLGWACKRISNSYNFLNALAQVDIKIKLTQEKLSNIFYFDLSLYSNAIIWIINNKFSCIFRWYYGYLFSSFSYLRTLIYVCCWCVIFLSCHLFFNTFSI